MRGNDKVLKDLSESLKAELTAINQYFLHAKMCENWSYSRLGAFYRKESIEEMVHAEKLMDRILFLDGSPNMTDIGPIKVGPTAKPKSKATSRRKCPPGSHRITPTKAPTKSENTQSR